MSSKSSRDTTSRPVRQLVQFQDARPVRTPGPVISGGSAILQSSKSQIPKLAKLPITNARGSSAFGAEEEPRPIPPYSKSSRSASSNDRHILGLPRPVAGDPLSPPTTERLPTGSTTVNSSIQSSILPEALTTSIAKKAASSGNRSRNVLRRKAAFTKQHAGGDKVMFAASSTGSVQSDMPALPSLTSIDDSRLGVHSMTERAPDIPQSERESLRPRRLKTPIEMVESSSSRILQELAGLATVVNAHNLPPLPTSNLLSTSSPSTRYSESPGMWSSRTSTPTSLSSYSPGIVQPVKSGQRLRRPSPIQARPPMFSRPFTMSPQAESVELQLAVSSSHSNPASREKIRQTIDINPPKKSTSYPGNPPPRKSSMKFRSMKQKTADEGYQGAGEHRNIDAKLHDTGSPVSRETAAISQSTAPTRSAVPPLRPSRQGTDKLELNPSPVIRSNLNALKTTGHKRRESIEKISPHNQPLQAGSASVESFQSSNSSRIPSPAIAPSRLPTRPTRTLAETAKQYPEAINTAQIKRFGLFNKKSKANLTADNTSLTDKPPHKGPVAGTGHEGYGRYMFRGRRTSVGSSSGISARSASTTISGTLSASSRKDSVDSQQELEIDDFLLHRLEPVIISGGGMDRLQLPWTQSEQSSSSLGGVTISTVSPTVENIPSQVRWHSSELLASSTEPLAQSSPSQVPAPDSRLMLQMETARNERQVTNREDGLVQNTRRHDINIVELDALMGTGSSASLVQDVGRKTARTPVDEGHTSPKRVDKGDKRGKGLKWNLFQKSHPINSNKTPPPAPRITPTIELHATIAQVSSKRSIAHYALLDADSDSLEDILNRIEESPPSETGLPVDVPAGSKTKKQHGESVLLPAMPTLLTDYSKSNKLRPASPKVFFNSNAREENMQGRPSRLASVGRIPRVVSTRDENRNQAQPRHKPVTPLVEIPDHEVNDYYTSGRPPLGIQTDVLPSRPFRSEPDTPEPSSAPAPDNKANAPTGTYLTKEPLILSPEMQPWISRPTGSAESILAAVSEGDVSSELRTIEDEIWAEYDDLLDNILSLDNGILVYPNISGVVEPLDFVREATRTLQAEPNEPDDIPPKTVSLESPSIILPDSVRSSDGSVHLRRSKIAAALRSSLSPAPRVSYSDSTAGYDDGNKDGINSGFSYLDDASVPTKVDRGSPLLSTVPISLSNFESTRHRNAMLFDIAERDRKGAIAQTNLRSASLMTSRWLSFGRVLFSPAHNHIKSRDQERILIIDGLGNDDWSFYCALTYPSAIVYSLSIRPASSGSAHPAAWQPPANHHLIHHASAEDIFPFPKGFFAVCILRFPSARSESGHRNMISECKRVLRHGGYLEMSVLDLDLVNMGTCTRKAVRLLKERIYLEDSDISLKPASDNIQRLLGRCGFDNLNRCIVSVPVAGTVVRSSDSSSSNPSASDLNLASGYPTGPVAMPSKTRHRPPSDDAEVSLGDLLSDPSPSASNDESIARMVARVGRWWYTRCYEIPVLPDGDLDCSIWADRKLLRECQQRGTGIRLLIAYAQKPSEVRRAVSV